MRLKTFWNTTKERILQLWRSKHLVLYLFFAGVATVFWFLHALGKEYAANVNVEVEYQNFPLEKEPQQNTTKRLTLNVTAYGFSLMRMHLKSAFYNYKVDVSKLKKHKLSSKDNLRYELSISAIRNQFEGQLGSGIVINSVFPEDIDFTVRTMKVKRVPIHSALKVGMKSGYMLSEVPKAEPDSVTLRGPVALLDTIEAIYTEDVPLDNVSSSFSKKVALRSPNKLVALLKTHTTLHYEIEEYIDEERIIPIHPLNFPDSVNVTLHPKDVQLKYRTYAKAKQHIKEENFILVVDYNTMNNFSQKLEVQALSLPEGITKVYMTPRYVNYIIRYK